MTSLPQSADAKYQDTESFFTSDQLALINPDKLPKHVAIIPDGNRRWAKKQLEKVQVGHRTGADTIMDIVKASQQLGIKTLTIYIFSTENWNRCDEEIRGILWLLDTYLQEQRPIMLQNGVRFGVIGDLSKFPENIVRSLAETKQLTSSCEKINLVFALNYGGRDEIRRSVLKIVDDVALSKLTKEEITEEKIASYLDSAPWGDPELLIRTSGEYRISNFLLWQLSYAEIFYTPTLWPDFTPAHFLDALVVFQKRERRLGGP